MTDDNTFKTKPEGAFQIDLHTARSATMYKVDAEIDPFSSDEIKLAVMLDAVVQTFDSVTPKAAAAILRTHAHVLELRE